MANEEDLSILKQGVKAWNGWRSRHPNYGIDLSAADLRETNLRGYNFRKANISEANLVNSDFRKADLTEANLNKSDLRAIDLRGATLARAFLSASNLYGVILENADLMGIHLSGANMREIRLRNSSLVKADVRNADLTKADLTKVNLIGTDLSGADLSQAQLAGSNFTDSRVSNVTFRNIDMSQVIGLDQVTHAGPSYISRDTLVLSKGKIPDIFLQGCGLSDWEIESARLYDPELSNEEINRTIYAIYDMRASKAIQCSPLFISYSRSDSRFVDRLEKHLNKNGVRFWRDVHDAKAGRLEKQIDRAMRLNPTVLLILSEHSLQSDWVEHEVHSARELEKEMKRDVLCPVALDDAWKTSPWEKRIMEQIMKYNILDFSEWNNDAKFNITFNKLLGGLELFYK